MKLKTKITLTKICATILWIFLLVFPLARIQSEHVSLTDSQITYNAEKHGDEMELTCDKKVVSGTVEIRVYKDSDVIKTITKEFEENEGKSFIIFIGDDEIPEDATEYKLYDCRVKTETQENIEMICYLLAIIFVIFLPSIWRLKVYNTKINGYDVEIYRGFKKKSLKVNGNLAYEEKKIFFFKPIKMQADCGDMQVNVEMSYFGKLVVYTKAKPSVEEKTEESVSNKTQTAENEEEMAKELFAKFENKDDENQNNAQKQPQEEKSNETINESSAEKPQETEDISQLNTEELNNLEIDTKPAQKRPRKVKTENVASDESDSQKSKPLKKTTAKKTTKKTVEEK